MHHIFLEIGRNNNVHILLINQWNKMKYTEKRGIEKGTIRKQIQILIINPFP